MPPCQHMCCYTIVIPQLFLLFLQIGFYFWLKTELCKVHLVDCVLLAYLLWKLKGAWELSCNGKRREQTGFFCSLKIKSNKSQIAKTKFSHKFANMFTVSYVLGRRGWEVIGGSAEQVQLPFRQLIAVTCLYNILCNVNMLELYHTSGVKHPKLAFSLWLN